MMWLGIEDTIISFKPLFRVGGGGRGRSTIIIIISFDQKDLLLYYLTAAVPLLVQNLQ
jgi:hypothetical protein